MRLRPAGSASGSQCRRPRRWWLGALLVGCLAGAASAQAQPFVYVANEFSSSVSQYDATGGALSPLTPPTVAVVAAGSFPTEVAVSPDGDSVYVANGFSNTVSQYDVGVGGALSAKTPASVAAGIDPFAVAVSPDGKSVYVTNESGNTVSQYNVGGGGALTPKIPAIVAAGAGPQGVAVSPDSKSIYVINAGGLPPVTGTVSQYNVDPLTGALSPKSPAIVATGVSPFGVAVSPEGKSVYVTNFNNFVTLNIGTVSQYDVGGGGALSPKTPATVATGVGPLGIAVTPLRVTTAGCRVRGHGRITAANGDQASFRGDAKATPPRGEELYRDNGPANPLRVRSLSVDAVTCSRDATSASISGKATINRTGPFDYRIDVRVDADKGAKDTYRIRLSNGYDSGAQPIRHGDIDIRLRSSEQHHHDGDADQGQGGNNQDGG